MTHQATRTCGSIDLAKGFFTLCILALHSGAFPTACYPLFRLGVPFFFIASSYFLFSKIRRQPGEERTILMGYLLRNARLYLVWFLLLLPVTLWIRKWLSMPPLQALLRFLQALAFDSTFRVSWYLMATIQGTLLISLLSRRIGTIGCLVLSLPFYALCCLYSSYAGLLSCHPLLEKVSRAYANLIAYPYNSFPVSFLWIALGKWLAEQSPETLPGKRAALTGLLISLCGLAAEVFLVQKLGLQSADDCCFLLIPASFFLFVLLLQTELPISFGKPLRKVCTLTFVTHASVITCLQHLLPRFVDSCTLACQLVFPAALLFCLGFSLLVLTLEQRPRLAWLKHLY